MRAYLIDEVSIPDMEKISGFLKKNAIPSKLSQLCWVRLPEDILNGVQTRHIDCRPHVFAVELGTDWFKLEFFVRSLSNMQCICIDYCSVRQRDFIINFAHQMIEDLNIKT